MIEFATGTPFLTCGEHLSSLPKIAQIEQKLLGLWASLGLVLFALGECAWRGAWSSFHSWFQWRKGKVQCISVCFYKLSVTTFIPTTTQFAVRPSPDPGTQPHTATSSKQQWMNGKACSDVNGLCRGQGKYAGALDGFIPVLVVTQLRVVSFPSEQTEYSIYELDSEPSMPFPEPLQPPLLLTLLEEPKFSKQVELEAARDGK